MSYVIEDLRFQESFASMLDYIGNGAFPFATNENHEEGSQNIPPHFLKCLYTEQDALDFLYPQGFDRFMMNYSSHKCRSGYMERKQYNYSILQHLINYSLETDFVKLMIQTGFSPVCLQRTF